MIQTETISFTLLLFLGVIAVLLHTAFWLFRHFVYPLISSVKISRLTDKWLFRGELIIWLVYIGFALYGFLLDSPLITLVLLTLILILGWPVWRDFIPGLLFRLEGQVHVGDSIRYMEQESRVEAIGWRNLRSNTPAGETIITPYRKLSEAVLIRKRAEGKLYKHAFTVTLPEKTKGGMAELKAYLWECPWSVSSHQPVIKSLGDAHFEITAFAADESAAERQKAYIAWRLGGK